MNKKRINELLQECFNASSKGFESALINQYYTERQANNGDKPNPNNLDLKSMDDVIYSFLSNPSRLTECQIETSTIRCKRVSDNCYKTISTRDLILESQTCKDEKAGIINDLAERLVPNDTSSQYYNLLYAVSLIYDISESRSKIGVGEYIQGLPIYLIHLIDSLVSVCYSKELSLELKRTVEIHTYRAISSLCRFCYEQGEEHSNIIDYFALCFQLCAFSLLLIAQESDRDSVFDSLSITFSIEYARVSIQNNDLENGNRFSVLAMVSKDSRERQRSFIYIAYCASENKQYQFAFDVLFSWINRNLLENVKKSCNLDPYESIVINNFLRGEEETDWRNDNPEALMEIYDHFAMLSINVYDSLRDSKIRCQLLDIARYYMKLALEHDKNTPRLYYDAGGIMVRAQKYSMAVDFYKRFFSMAPSAEARLCALRLIITTHQKIITKRTPKWLESITKEYISCYEKMLNSNSSKEVLEGRNLYFILTSCEELAEEHREEIRYSLFKIDNAANMILHCLRRTSHNDNGFNTHFELLREDEKRKISLIRSAKSQECIAVENNEDSKIAYYTTLKTLSYLFDDHSVQNGDSINRLTMMHARYMNDPDEGLILLNSLKKWLPADPEDLRNILYDQKYVFLKSFTGLVDQLNMWTLYGSDRADGEDCNGCCVCLAPETFDKGSDAQGDGKSRSTIHAEDDYGLFNVAYIKDEKLFVAGEESPILERHYEELKRQIKELNNVMNHTSEKENKIISDCLVRLLEKPMFLFKDKSYYLEEESRIIITRDFSDRIGVEEFKLDIPKLHIKPELQVFPERIILGPKVKNADFWLPHLQYELSKIKDKWFYDKEYEPTVRKSRINIR